jgi:ribonuclease P protein component
MRIDTLKRRAEFLRIRGGARCARGAFVLEARTRSGAGGTDKAIAAGPRFGFTVTKKLGGAVIRNRIRRRLREALRSLPAETALPGHDYVLVARATAATCNFASLTQELASALSQVNRTIQRGAGDTARSHKRAGAGSPTEAKYAQAQPRSRRDQGSAATREKR